MGEGTALASRVHEAIAAADTWEPVVEAFVHREDADVKQAEPGAGPLHGLAVTVKDNIAVAGRTMTAGSSWWRATPQEDAAAWHRLRRAGAILVGRVNMHEFAYGASTVNERAQTTRNPWSPDRIAGGSSGGSAVSVATGAADASLGTDTGGSVRIPAALCGVTGFKPTFGSVSTSGVLPLSTSCDHLGVLAPDVRGCRSVWDVIADVPPSPSSGARLSGTRVGLLAEHLGAADQEVADRVMEVVERLRDRGAVVDELVLPDEVTAAAAGSTVVAFEAAQVHRAWLDDPASDYGDDVRARLERGRAVSARHYRAARAERARLAEILRLCQTGYDVVLGPTVPLCAPTVSDVVADDGSLQARLLRNTYIYNVTGQPAVSLPCGTNAAGLPIGVQLAGAFGADGALLDLAAAVERVVAA